MGSKSPQLLLFTLFLVTLLLNASAARRSVMANTTAAWKPIPRLDDPHVVKIAQFAVSEYNKHLKKLQLSYQKVVKGESQTVAGTNYRLTITTKGQGKWEAVVWDKPWEHFRQLTSFVAIN